MPISRPLIVYGDRDPLYPVEIAVAMYAQDTRVRDLEICASLRAISRGGVERRSSVEGRVHASSAEVPHAYSQVGGQWGAGCRDCLWR